MTAPSIFDRAAIARHLRRAQTIPTDDEPHPLVARIEEDVADRIAGVLRDFSRGVVLAPFQTRLAATLTGLERVGPMSTASPLVGWPGTDAIVDDEALPLGPASVDLLISLLSLQATNDLPGALVQARRALRPDGLFFAVVFGEATLRELRDIMLRAESVMTGGASPRVAPFAGVRDLGGLLQRAGFALPVIDNDVIEITYSSSTALFQELRGFGLANPLADRARQFFRRDVLGEAMRLYAQTYGDSDGRIPATVELVTLTGWAPDESQPKPLAPGSATTRLADVLGTSSSTTD
ncbi:MAG: methyltransferase domain-containing protein [Pseudomonadota bacterium]